MTIKRIDPGPRQIKPPDTTRTETAGGNAVGSTSEVKPTDAFGVKPPEETAAIRAAKPPPTVIANPPDFVDIGLGPTGMMEMLETIAAGRSALGVELRGDPVLGVHQNIRVDWFHQLGKIDEAIEKRYGIDRIPIYPPTGKPFKLADVFYRSDQQSGPLDFPEIYAGAKDPKTGKEQNIGGVIHNIVFEDARNATKAANGGKPRIVSVPPPPVPDKADPSKVRQDMREVLDGPSTFQASISNYTGMLRKYLELMEQQDLSRGLPPRARVLTNARVTQDAAGNVTGLVRQPNGKTRIIVEQVVDENLPGERPKKVRAPGTQEIDLGVPTLFSLTTGASIGPEARSLGYTQSEIAYTDEATGETIYAQQGWIVGEVSANVGGQLIRRISTETDPETGEDQTVRQITVGHESADRIGWTLIQVPDFASFDPIKAGKVPANTSPKSPEFAKAAQDLLYHYFTSHAGPVLHIPTEQVEAMRMVFGPGAFTLNQRIGEVKVVIDDLTMPVGNSARLTVNGVVGGDLMGNAHFLTSGGSMTGMIGHAQRVGQFWLDLEQGVEEEAAMTKLADAIRTDTLAWVAVSAREFFDVLPVNFGKKNAEALKLASENTAGKKKPRQPNFGLEGVLGATNWAKVIEMLSVGAFGKPNIDFYVPAKEIDVLGDTHLPDPSKPFWVRTRPPPPAAHVD